MTDVIEEIVSMPWTTPPGSGATVYVWNGYSLAERDRRWNAVRAGAAQAGFDCILVPLGDGIDARYMTQLRCSAMVLPTDGRAPIVVADRRSNNQWVPDPWQTGREWAEPMGEALRDLGFARARIGVAGLKGGRMTHCDAHRRRGQPHRVRNRHEQSAQRSFRRRHGCDRSWCAM